MYVGIYAYTHVHIHIENNLPEKYWVSHNGQENQANKWHYLPRGKSCFSRLDLDLCLFSIGQQNQVTSGKNGQVQLMILFKYNPKTAKV